AQNQYNLLERGAEADLLPVCSKYGLGMIPYFPLASGFLTGKYRRDEPPPEGTRLAGRTMGQNRLTDENFSILEKLEGFAQQRDHSMGELALAWLASHANVSSVIAGATRPEQVEDNARAFDWHLTPEDMKALDEIMDWQPAASRRG